MKKLLLVPLALVLAVLLTACGSHAGSGTLIGVRFTDSIGSGGKANGCIQPGHRITTTDKVYYLPGPGNQRQDQWQTGNDDADHRDLVAYSKDGVAMNLVLNENFSLHGDCDSLDLFMKTIGLTRQAYFKDDKEYLPGWITAMNYYISPVVTKRVKTEVAKYNADELWPSTELYDQICSDVDGPATDGFPNTIESQVADVTNGNKLYTSFRCDISSIQADPSYQEDINARRAAKTQAQTAEFNKKAQIAQAQADGAVKVAQAKAEANTRKATILGFKLPGMTYQEAVQAYLKWVTIDGGGNPFQPSGSLITPN